MPPRIWNTRRQALGNVLPLAVGLIVGIGLYRTGPIFASLAGILAAYLGVDRWGFFENARIETELRELTRSSGELIGFVFRQPPTMLDAHAQIGLLHFDLDRLEIVTEEGGIVIRRDDIETMGRRRNIHSILHLGGWITITLKNGQEFRLESRRYHTMHASRLRTNQLFLELALWLNEKGPA